jgi:molybdopterin-synthase adenylyltransferase
MVDDRRYARQLTLAEIGPAGQERLRAASVLIVGCGALGSTQAGLLARAGVGRLRIVDRDVIETHNLQRQLLFDEDDVAARLPKAEAAARRLARINSEVRVEARVLHVSAASLPPLLDGVDVVLDATDNIETRYLVNDACVARGLPWIYGGVLGTSGVTMTIRPGLGPCLRCLFPELPAPGTMPSCETMGVLNTNPSIIAALQVTQALKLIVGAEIAPGLLVAADPWRLSFRTITVARDPACPCCAGRDFPFLAARADAATVLGRGAVQVDPRSPIEVDLAELARRLGGTSTGLLVQAEVEGYGLTVFADGRTIVKGTTDPELARALCARYLER